MKPANLIISAALLLAASFPVRAESFAAWAAKAAKLEKRGDTDGALGSYSQALKLWKKKDGKASKAKVLSSRAALYEKSQSWEDALKDLKEAAAISTRTASYPYRAGRAYLELGHASEAITWFYKATKLNLNYKEAYYDRARAYEATGDLQFAREDYKTACKLGVKAACARDKSLKKGEKPAAPAPDEFAAAPEKPKRKGSIEVKRKVRVAKVSSKAMPACIDGLNKCVGDGGTFGDCVSQAQTCEKKAGEGCCPEACVIAFKKLANERSEAEAFRETFKLNANCVETATARTTKEAYGEPKKEGAGSSDEGKSDGGE